MEIEHFLHAHDLKLSEKTYEDEVFCNGCKGRIAGQIFVCENCKFFLHKCCTQLPFEIQHFLHPHPLFLYISSTRCELCEEDLSGFVYNCGQCSFQVDAKCAQLPAIKYEDEEEHILHFSHHHALSLFENMEDHETCCKICGKLCLDPTYGCNECNFYLHKSCLDVPQKIFSVFHPCPVFLVLIVRSLTNRCDFCNGSCSGLVYYCAMCKFQLHVGCSLQPMTEYEGHEAIQHICFLGHRSSNLDRRIDDATNVCNECNLFLHKSYSEHPREIHASIHPAHRLFLLKIVSQSSKYERCGACLKNCDGFIFCCVDLCGFQVGFECVSLIPAIEFVDHAHRLTFVENMYGEFQCSACKSSCTDRSAFRCLECNFSLHLHCGPLPYTIKHSCHIHPLTFEDYVVEDDRDDFDFYCHTCEKERDPLLCVYYCQHCLYTAHIECVISEVIASLKGERGDVMLKTVGKPIARKNKVIISKKMLVNEMEQDEVAELAEHENEMDKYTMEEQVDISPALSLDDVIDSLTEQERKEFDDIYETMKSKMNGTGEPSSGEEDDKSSSTPEVSPYSDVAFKQLMERLNSKISLGERIQCVLSDHDKEVASFEHHMVPQIVIPVLNDLNAKYGDIGANCISSPRVKSVFLSYLGLVIYSMRRTKFYEITEDILHDWWSYLKLVRQAGFEIQFIFNHLEQVTRAHFGLEAKKFAEETSTRQKQEIELISEEIKKLTAKLQEHEEQHKLHEIHVKSATTSFMKQCIDDGTAVKWKPAADRLL